MCSLACSPTHSLYSCLACCLCVQLQVEVAQWKHMYEREALRHAAQASLGQTIAEAKVCAGTAPHTPPLLPAELGVRLHLTDPRALCVLACPRFAPWRTPRRGGRCLLQAGPGPGQACGVPAPRTLRPWPASVNALPRPKPSWTPSPQRWARCRRSPCSSCWLEPREEGAPIDHPRAPTTRLLVLVDGHGLH